MSLINGKLRSEHRYGQAVRNVLNYPSFFDYTLVNTFTKNNTPVVADYWLCGFSDAEASFQVKMVVSVNRKEIRLNFQVDQKTESVLVDIRNYLGGNVYHRSSQDTYYYGSTSFGVARNVIRYFDKYPMLSCKHVNYLRWRKTYLLVQRREHLTQAGWDAIHKIKSDMRYSAATSQSKIES
jgi:hypothetical protein